jgi:HisA/HisF family protein
VWPCLILNGALNDRMELLPVLDLMAGRVVRGIAGRRSEYRPIDSRLTPSCEPAAVAAALDRQFGLQRLYLADLDAIAGAPPARDVYARLQADGFALWVDAGVRTIGDAVHVRSLGVERVIVGLETIAGPDVLTAAVSELGERVIFSLDLQAGLPVGDLAAWPERGVHGILDRAVAAGIGGIIVLDVARVGVGAGTGTEGLCSWIKKKYPRLPVYAGGGVRDAADLRVLRDRGVRGALVASALHDGNLSRADWENL